MIFFPRTGVFFATVRTGSLVHNALFLGVRHMDNKCGHVKFENSLFRQLSVILSKHVGRPCQTTIHCVSLSHVSRSGRTTVKIKQNTICKMSLLRIDLKPNKRHKLALLSTCTHASVWSSFTGVHSGTKQSEWRHSCSSIVASEKAQVFQALAATDPEYAAKSANFRNFPVGEEMGDSSFEILGMMSRMAFTIFAA